MTGERCTKGTADSIGLGSAAGYELGLRSLIKHGI